MKKKYLLPVVVGIVSTIIPTVLGYTIFTWQYWWIALPIVLMSWVVVPLNEYINRW